MNLCEIEAQRPVSIQLPIETAVYCLQFYNSSRVILHTGNTFYFNFETLFSYKKSVRLFYLTIFFYENTDFHLKKLMKFPLKKDLPFVHKNFTRQTFAEIVANGHFSDQSKNNLVT